jgi:hypothetical protein
MAINVQARGKRIQLRVMHRLLLEPFFFTVDAEVEARNCGEQLHALLDRGIVPSELIAEARKGPDDPLLIEVIRAYMKGAIRKRVGALGRVIDWHLRRATPAGQIPPANALRLLSKGYSAYTRAEAEELARKDKEPKRDQVRDRRLTAEECRAAEAALNGE